MNDNIILEPSTEGKKRKNFTIIDNPLIDDITTFDLSDSAFRMLVTLIRYDGLETIIFSAKTLSEKIGKKPRTIFALLKELEDKGYITREQRHFKTSSNLIRQTSSVISLEPYWDKVSRAQEKWIDTHKPASILTSSESAKNGTLEGVPILALPNSSDLDAPDSSVDAGLEDVSRECKKWHSDKDSDKDISNHPGPESINTPGVEVEKNDDDDDDNKTKYSSNPDSKFLSTMDSKTLNELTEYMANIRKWLLEYDAIEEPSIRNQRVVEVPLLRRWFDAGIPEACVLAGVRTTMSRHKKGKKIQSVKYFEKEVQNAFAEYNKVKAQDKAIKDSTSKALSRMKELLYGKQAGSV